MKTILITSIILEYLYYPQSVLEVILQVQKYAIISDFLQKQWIEVEFLDFFDLIDTGIILVITLPILCSRSNFTIPYSLVIPACFLNLYIKQKVPGIGSIFHIILEKWLFIPSLSCTNPLSHSSLPHSQALHSLTCTKKYNCKTHVRISANVQSKSLTQGQNHSRVWHSKEW